MPRFKLTPHSDPNLAVEFDGLDVSSALNVASRVRFRQADVAQDGVYICTIRSHDEDHSGFWIVERHKAAAVLPALEGEAGQALSA